MKRFGLFWFFLLLTDEHKMVHQISLGFLIDIVRNKSLCLILKVVKAILELKDP